ncbi:MAG TPA: hypothetical protein VLI54_06285 [Bacillota bacterium]|nr:hypothetical protein [Bacillota bacterium]
MIIVFFMVIILATGGALVASKKKHSLPLKVLLAALYVSLLALLVNTYSAAVTADEKGLDGGAAGWFGDKWLLVLAVLIVAIIALQVVALTKKQPKA